MRKGILFYTCNHDLKLCGVLTAHIDDLFPVVNWRQFWLELSRLFSYEGFWGIKYTFGDYIPGSRNMFVYTGITKMSWSVTLQNICYCIWHDVRTHYGFEIETKGHTIGRSPYNMNCNPNILTRYWFTADNKHNYSTVWFWFSHLSCVYLGLTGKYTNGPWIIIKVRTKLRICDHFNILTVTFWRQWKTVR